MQKGEVGCEGGKRNELKTHLIYVRSFYSSFLKLGRGFNRKWIAHFRKKVMRVG